MIRIAIPIFQKRISPVLDSCKRLIIVDAEKGREKVRTELFLDNLSLKDRCQFIIKVKVDIIICCGISNLFETMLKSNDIQLICGIVGNAEQVIIAYLKNRLDDPCYHIHEVKTH